MKLIAKPTLSKNHITTTAVHPTKTKSSRQMSPSCTGTCRHIAPRCCTVSRVSVLGIGNNAIFCELTKDLPQLRYPLHPTLAQHRLTQIANNYHSRSISLYLYYSDYVCVRWMNLLELLLQDLDSCNVPISN